MPVLYLALVFTWPFSEAIITLQPLGTAYLPFEYKDGVLRYGIRKEPIEGFGFDTTNSWVYTMGDADSKLYGFWKYG